MPFATARDDATSTSFEYVLEGCNFDRRSCNLVISWSKSSEDSAVSAKRIDGVFSPLLFSYKLRDLLSSLISTTYYSISHLKTAMNTKKGRGIFRNCGKETNEHNNHKK